MARMASLAAIALLAITMLPTALRADSVGPSCATCFGNVYSLTYSPVPNLNNVFDVTFSVNTAGFNLGGATLNAVSFKVAPSTRDYDFVKFISDSQNVPVNLRFGAVNANSLDGCKTGGADGFVCFGGFSLPVPAGTYSFSFEVTTASLLTGVGEAGLKALFLDANGHVAAITSLDNVTLQLNSTGPTTAAVPEPGTLILLGSGLLGMGGLARLLWFRK